MFSNRIKAYLMLLLVSIIWGIASPIIKLTLNDIPADLFLFYRFLISTVVAIPFVLRFSPSLKKIFGSIRSIAAHSIFTAILSLGFLFWGMEKTTVLNASLIQTLGPLIVSFFGYRFLNDRITAKEKKGLLIAFLGSMVIYIELLLFKNGGLGQMEGNLLILAYLISNAIGAVILKKLLQKDFNPLFLSNLSFILAFISMLPIMLSKYGYGSLVDTLFTLPTNAIMGLLYMALISGTLAYTLGNIAQRSIEISESAPFSYLPPVFASILAVVWLGEVPTLYFLTGSIVIILGVIIAEIKFKY